MLLSPLIRITTVRGFTSNTVHTRRLLATSSQIILEASTQNKLETNKRISKRVFSSVTKDQDDEDDDLDTELDNILNGGGIDSEIKPKNKGRKPVPDVFLKDDDSDDDEEDPVSKSEHTSDDLSITNPFWVQAGMKTEVIDLLSQKGITSFTPVQGTSFEPILSGRDMICRSRTGTGKTLAFGIPSLHRLAQRAEEKGRTDPRSGRMRKGRAPAMLVLCPTRELARQVHEELSNFCKSFGLFSDVFHGGVSYEPQSRSLRFGIDVLVGTPGRIIDHINRGNLDLSELDIAVLDEADEMLNMGFADDVEQIMESSGEDEKVQMCLFSATTPPWVKQIAEQYQTNDVLEIDSTTKEGGGARVATTVRHLAIQVPPGVESRKQILEDIIAVEISKESENRFNNIGDDEETEKNNPVAYAINLAKRNSTSAMQQKIFGKTIVFTETKSLADSLVSGGVFKSLTAQALHGDIGQKQRDSTLAAFRAGAFNVLVATDVAARGIDIQDVDLVVQFEPPKDVDTYVHRSGRTGRAGRSGTSVLLFGTDQARNIVNIERNLGHNFKFTLAGPPSIEAALNAAAKTSAIAVCGIPEKTAQHFQTAATELLEQEGNAEMIIAKCLAAISRRGSAVESRSLLTGEKGLVTIEMSFEQGNRNVSPADVMFTVSKIARMIRRENDGEQFLADVGKIITNPESGTAMFDMTFDEANTLIEFCDGNDDVGGGASFSILKEMDIQRGRYFGMNPNRGGRGRNDNYRGGGGYRGNNQGRGGGYRGNNYQGRGGGYRGNNNRDGGYEDRRGGYNDRRGGYNNKRGNNNYRSWDDNSGGDGRRRNPRRFSSDRGWH